MKSISKDKPRIPVRNFRDLPAAFGELRRGDVAGRILLKIGD